MENNVKSETEVFCSYNEKDVKFLKELEKHMIPIKRMGFTLWHANYVIVGDLHEEEIKKHLDKACIILLLISPDSIASNNFNIEMKRAAERYECNKAKVIPIVLRPTNWRDHPFGSTTLGQLKAPRDGEPITDAQNDGAWMEVVEAIGRVVNGLPIEPRIPQKGGPVTKPLQSQGATPDPPPAATITDEPVNPLIPVLYPSSRRTILITGLTAGLAAVGVSVWWIGSHYPFLPTCAPSPVSKAVSSEGLKNPNLLLWGADPGKNSTSVASYAPYAFYNGNGEVIGFEADIARAIARLMDVNQKCYPTKYHIDIENDLQAENIDIILNGWEITDDRQKDEIFSIPYYRYSQQLVVLANDKRFLNYDESSQITLDDLKSQNYMFGTGASYKAADILRNEKLQLHTSDEPIDDLNQGKVDIIMVDTPIVAFYIKGKGTGATPFPSLRPIGKPLFPNGNYVIGIKKSSLRAQKLQQEIDQALQIMKQDGTLKRIYQKWGLWNEFQTGVDIIDCI